jgi:cysteine sulfinate desulfinase/cysteine desulfurase-like protein
MSDAGARKSAILLMALGEDRAAAVLGALDTSEVEALGLAMAKLSQVSKEELSEVMAEFRDETEQLSVLHLDAETLTRALDVEGYVVGSGSACVADGKPSHVLAAMGRVTHGNVRLMLPVDLDLAVLDDFTSTLVTTIGRLREAAGVADL